jgi:ribosomal protein S18 acetylase RimI-like enzyme
VKEKARPKLRRGVRADADMLVRLIDMSSHGGIGEHYRQLYGADIDWRDRARLEIMAGGPELGFQNAVIVSIGGSDAGGMILNPIKNSFIFTGPEDSRTGRIERLIAKAPGSLFIRELAVFPSHRGKGIGRMLVGFAVDYARSQEIGSVSLTVNSDNAPARALYDSEGFSPIVEDRIDGRDITLMIRKLA